MVIYLSETQFWWCISIHLICNRYSRKDHSPVAGHRLLHWEASSVSAACDADMASEGYGTFGNWQIRHPNPSKLKQCDEPNAQIPPDSVYIAHKQTIYVYARCVFRSEPSWYINILLVILKISPGEYKSTGFWFFFCCSIFVFFFSSNNEWMAYPVMGNGVFVSAVVSYEYTEWSTSIAFAAAHAIQSAGGERYVQ